MRVVLGGIQTAVSEQLLHCIDVRSTVQKMCGERMPDDVRAALAKRARLRNIMVDAAVNKSRVQFATTVRHNQEFADTGPVPHVFLGEIKQGFRHRN